MLAIALTLLTLLPAQPGLAQPSGADLVNGLRWDLRLWAGQRWAREGEITNFDRVEFFACLENGGEDELRVSLRKLPRGCTFTLTREGHEPVRRHMSPEFEVYGRHFSRLEWEEPAFYVEGTIYPMFGALAPGSYTLQVELAADSYFTNAMGYRPAVVRSEPVEFVVIRTSLEAASARAKPTTDVSLSLMELEGQDVVVLSNQRSEAVTFDTWGLITSERPASSLMYAMRWDGHRWVSQDFGGYCGTGLEKNVIEVNETVVLMLPAGYSRGILRLVQRYTYFDGQGKAWGTARSEALLVLDD